jgi:hypothetical protein
MKKRYKIIFYCTLCCSALLAISNSFASSSGLSGYVYNYTGLPMNVSAAAVYNSSDIQYVTLNNQPAQGANYTLSPGQGIPYSIGSDFPSNDALDMQTCNAPNQGSCTGFSGMCYFEIPGGNGHWTVAAVVGSVKCVIDGKNLFMTNQSAGTSSRH